jgi:hypothetical protein
MSRQLWTIKILYKSGIWIVTREPIFSHKFEFGRSLGISLEVECHEVKVIPNLELLVTFGMSLEGVCHELCLYIISLKVHGKFGGDQKFLEESSLLIGNEKVMSSERGWSLTKNLPLAPEISSNPQTVSISNGKIFNFIWISGRSALSFFT